MNNQTLINNPKDVKLIDFIDSFAHVFKTQEETIYTIETVLTNKDSKWYIEYLTHEDLLYDFAMFMYSLPEEELQRWLFKPDTTPALVNRFLVMQRE